jgi:hypothetical protein
MPQRAEIWYAERSLAASLVRPLRRSFAVRQMPNGRKGRQHTPTAAEGPVVCFADLDKGDLAGWRRLAKRAPRVRLIGVARNGSSRGAEGCFATLPHSADPAVVRKTVDAALANIRLAERERELEAELARAEREMEELNRIGVALSQTREMDALLKLILTKAREITGADAGSLYLVEESRPDTLTGEPGEIHLRFKLTQNDSVQFPFAEFELPLEEGSIAGYTTLHGEVINLADVHRIPRNRPYRFNASFEKKTGYRTRSMLTLPMKNGRGEVIGILQLINCKVNPSARLTSPSAVSREVQPFSERAARLALSLASQAAVAYENGRLYQDIEKLFEGFVQASVKSRR